jgi:predicted transcriptional regulator/transcriptional regulator with XRE-family HTH domain
MTRILVGTKLRDRRRAMGITQRALAERVGISASYLNLIEGNHRRIGGSVLKNLADALQATVDEFDGAAERRLVDDLMEVAATPEIEPLQVDPRGAADLAAAHPQWARALVALHRACRERTQTVVALSDRLNQDPFLGDAVHDLLSKATAVRSACEILAGQGPLGPAERQRFLAMISEDSRRLGDVASALAGFFDTARAPARPVSPIEEVDDFIAEHDNHFPQLELVAQRIRHAARLDDAGRDGFEAALIAWLHHTHAVRVMTASEADLAPLGHDPAAHFDSATRTLRLMDTAPGSTRRFELARLAGELAASDEFAAMSSGAAQLGSGASRRRAQRALSSYLAAAIVLPYDAMLNAALAARYDIDHLCRRFDASFEQVSHRLVTLRRPGAQGLRFGFLRVDPSGHISKGQPLPGLPLPRYGNACALWAVYKAFQTPGVFERQLAEFPSGERYLFLARAVEKPRSVFLAPRRFVSIMLACDVLQADALVYADGLDVSSKAPAVPVGPTCRTCVRSRCDWRQEDPILDAGWR